MDYENSICFSPEIPERLNEKAFLIDKRLYLFAYYEPKAYIPTESYRSKFVTAIINLYGLLWDCCPFMPRLLETANSILLNNWVQVKNDFQALRNTTSAFRSIFCHNNSDAYPLNAVHFEIAEQWIFLQCRINKEIDDLNDNEWEKLLFAFHNQSLSANSSSLAFQGPASLAYCFARIRTIRERWVRS